MDLIVQLTNMLIENWEKAVWIILIIVLVIIFLNPEKVFIWRSCLASLFVNCCSGARKTKLGDKIRGTILKTTKELSKENTEILPYDLKIKWVKEEDRQTFLENNQVIVRMSHTENPQRNVTIAVTEYVKNGLMPTARRYIDDKVREAADLTIARKIVSIGWKEALAYYDSKVMDPLITSDDELRELVEKLLDIDKSGMLIPLLLNEFIKAAKLVYPERPDPRLLEESKELVNYLIEFARRERGVLITENIFNRQYFKIQIHLAVGNINPEIESLKHHLKHIKRGLTSGLDTFYIMGLGRKCKVAEELSDLANVDDRISKIIFHKFKRKFNLGNVDGICIELRASDH